MDEQDYLQLIAQVESALREVGAGELADPNLYVWRDGETGEVRRHDPKKHLIEMLLAFDRYLAIRDRATFDHAIGRINETLSEGRIEGAVVVPTGQFEDGPPLSLADAPMLSDVRQALRRLIDDLFDEREPPRYRDG